MFSAFSFLNLLNVPIKKGTKLKLTYCFFMHILYQKG